MSSALALLAAVALDGCTASLLGGTGSPTVLSIEPNHTDPGVGVSVTIVGENFWPKVQSSYRSGVATEVDATFVASLGEYLLIDVVWVDGQTLTATTPVDLPSGRYDLTVITPNGTAGMLPDAFWVGCDTHQTFHLDADNDGFGDPAVTVAACTPPAGYVVDGSDCDDTDAAERPDVTWFPDADGDGFGDSSAVGSACERRAPTDVLNAEDCDDDPVGCGAGCFPGNPTPDGCDGLDQNCDGSIDEEPDILWYHDADGDGFTNNTDTVVQCTDPDGPAGAWVGVATAHDCADMPGSDPACGGLDGAQCAPGLLDVCDGIDDDCDPSSADGSEDPALGSACDGGDSDLCADDVYTGCSGGVLTCSLGADTLDVCDGIDNDCDPSSADGSEDPALGSACDGPDSDECEEGIFVGCSGGSLVCNDATGDSTEGPGLDPTCSDGLDNDCDGATDADDTECCGDTCGSCSAGGCCVEACTTSCTRTCDSCDCLFDCSDNNGTCRFTCQGTADCTIDCTNSEECYATCRDGALCNIDCRYSDEECWVSCTLGAQCLLNCYGADDCGFSSCSGGAASCGNGVRVCNRPCP